jgi:hypothetical protein
MALAPEDAMRRIDLQLAHVWMVRAFLKHSEEAQEDDEVAAIHRDLYDVMLAVGPAHHSGDGRQYLQVLAKKLGKLKRAARAFSELQPQVSTHTNFQMAVRSLAAAVDSVEAILGELN